MKINVSASKILRASDPEVLFPNDLGLAKQLFHDLARHYHPDLCKLKNATEVFQKVNALYNAAVTKIEAGTWDKSAAGALFRWDFELGKALVSDTELVYRLDPNVDFSPLASNAASITTKFKFANARMEKEVSRYLPPKISVDERPSGISVRTAIPKDYIPLREVIRYFGGTVDPKHTCWIVSSLLNLACYLNYAKIVHQNISADTYWINPEDHSGALLGGWWYAAKTDDPVRALPTRTHAILPWSVQLHQTAQHITDLELIRLTGREMLATLPKPKIPGSILKWLSGPLSNSKAVDLYQDWAKVLVAEFGPRKFTTMVVDRTKLGS